MAFIKSVRKQVDKKMPKTLDLDYKDSKKGFINNKRDLTSPAKEFIS
jgi:hypothetical protein